MSEPTFEQLRIPAALILIIIVLFAFLPRGADDPASADAASGPRSSPTAGQPGGAVTATPTGTPIPSATPAPTLAPTPAPAATPEPTATPVADTGFEAEVLACRSISGPSCNGELETVPGDLAILTALVRFSDASAGDAIAVVLDGPGGTIAGG